MGENKIKESGFSVARVLCCDGIADTADQIVIPDFQRPYCWTVSDIQKILDDVDDLRFVDQEYLEDQYYFGSICFRKNEKGKLLELLDGQQRLTSFLILTDVLTGLAEKLPDPGSESLDEDTQRLNTDIRSLNEKIKAECLFGKRDWKSRFLYKDPATKAQIRRVRQDILASYRSLRGFKKILVKDKAENHERQFYLQTLFHDLKRLRYILAQGYVAVRLLNTVYGARQFFMAENNRGKAMTLLDILKAYHMRFDDSQSDSAEKIFDDSQSVSAEKISHANRRRRIAEIWSRFMPMVADGEAGSMNGVQEQYQLVDQLVLPSLLLPYGVEIPSANLPEHADLLKGIIGTHQGDRIVDRKYAERLKAWKEESFQPQHFDLMEPVLPGLFFFEKLDYYRRLAEAVRKIIKIYVPNGCDKASELFGEAERILECAMICWADRFMQYGKNKSADEFFECLNKDLSFHNYVMLFLRFLRRWKYQNEQRGVYKSIRWSAVYRILDFYYPQKNLLLLPYRSNSPAECRRQFLILTSYEKLANKLGDQAELYKRTIQQEMTEAQTVDPSKESNHG